MEPRTFFVALLSVAGLAAPASASAQEALYLQSLAATCASCHGTHGRTVPGSSVAPLAGMPRETMISQLQAFRAGARPATIMHQLAKGYSDAQIEQLAAFFATRKP